MSFNDSECNYPSKIYCLNPSGCWWDVLVASKLDHLSPELFTFGFIVWVIGITCDRLNVRNAINRKTERVLNCLSCSLSLYQWIFADNQLENVCHQVSIRFTHKHSHAHTRCSGLCNHRLCVCDGGGGAGAAEVAAERSCCEVNVISRKWCVCVGYRKWQPQLVVTIKKRKCWNGILCLLQEQLQVSESDIYLKD